MIKVLLATLLLATPAMAKSPICNPAGWADELEIMFDGPPRFVGEIVGGGVMELYVDAKGKWLLVATSPTLTCLIATGEGGEMTDDKK